MWRSSVCTVCVAKAEASACTRQAGWGLSYTGGWGFSYTGAHGRRAGASATRGRSL